MIENVLVKLGILNDHDHDQYNRVELFLEDAERAIKIAIRKSENFVGFVRRWRWLVIANSVQKLLKVKPLMVIACRL